MLPETLVPCKTLQHLHASKKRSFQTKWQKVSVVHTIRTFPPDVRTKYPHSSQFMHRVLEGRSFPAAAPSYQNIYVAIFPVVQLPFLDPPLVQQRGWGLSRSYLKKTIPSLRGDRDLMLRVSNRMGSGPASIPMFNVTFKHQPTTLVDLLCLFCYKSRRKLL